MVVVDLHSGKVLFKSVKLDLFLIHHFELLSIYMSYWLFLPFLLFFGLLFYLLLLNKPTLPQKIDLGFKSLFFSFGSRCHFLIELFQAVYILVVLLLQKQLTKIFNRYDSKFETSFQEAQILFFGVF